MRLRACNEAGCGQSTVIFHVKGIAISSLTSWHNSRFIDTYNSVHEAAIETLAAAGVVSGCGPESFCPAEELTRGQFASLLARAFRDLVPGDDLDYFGDDDDSVHEAAVNALAAAGVVSGCGPGSFCPAEELTRGQMATMLARALPGPAPDDTEDYYRDDDGSAHEAAVNALTAKGIVSGCGPDRFCPADPIRRDHAAAILARALELIPAETNPPPWRLRPVVYDIGGGGATDLQAPTGDDRVFFTTRAGMVHIIADGTVWPFLDLTAEVLSTGDERGLLGLAFHPGYAANRKFFVFYTDLDGHSQVYQYQADPQNPNRADTSTARHVITFEQTSYTGWHLGGQLQFGPDGYLYIAVGDGTFEAESQNLRTALGTILRIDVDNGDPYSIPVDNPFADGQEGLPEIWAYGLRNPWRFSFDGPHIYIADLGVNSFEEINIADSSEGAINYGWNIVEGTRCTAPPNCDTAGLFNPQVEYSHGEGIAVIGGYVYRGNAIPEMTGHYFYSDFSGVWIRTFLYDNGQITQHRKWRRPDGNLTPRTRSFGNKIHSLGIDGHGELYILTDRSVYKIVPAVTPVP